MNQTDYLKNHPEMFDTESRQVKADKIIAVLKDYRNDNLSKTVWVFPANKAQVTIMNPAVLDVGCSTGVITEALSTYFYWVKGIDIDEKAIKYAWENFKFKKRNLEFHVKDAMNIDFPKSDKSFDIVICNHIYEHVSNPHKMMSEIYRVLKPSGICYFAAGNRLNIIEGHYGLPFLSVMPKWMGHLYLRITGKGKSYYEIHLTVWQLRKLVKQFEIIDYTKKIINDPEKFSATDMVQAGSWKQKVAKFIIKYLYCLCPTYVWILKKGD